MGITGINIFAAPHHTGFVSKHCCTAIIKETSRFAHDGKASAGPQRRDKQSNIRAGRSKMDPKIDLFGKVDIRLLAILGIKKVVFWTFS